MARVLHLIKSPEVRLALATVDAQLAAGDTVTVALLHDAPAPKLPPAVHVHRVPADLSHTALLELIFQSDQVITW